MNVDLLPPSFSAHEAEGHQCGECSSFSDAGRGIYSGWCFMMGKPRSPHLGPVYIGRIEKLTLADGSRVFLRPDGEEGLCFTPRHECTSLVPPERYGSVTRTETAKSGQKTPFLHHAHDVSRTESDKIVAADHG